MAVFFEAFLGRPLSSNELRQVTDEFIEFHAANGLSRAAIRDNARKFESHARLLRDAAAGPAALSMRHERITLNYFNPDLQNTLFLQLLVKPDPVRVIDVRSRRLMTEADVVALANLHRFARSQDAPRHQTPTRRQIEELVLVLRAIVGGNSGNMPQFFAEAAAFWSGLQKAWPALNAGERALIRAYAARTWRIQMPVELYSRVWGLDPQAASKRHADDVSARLSAITDINMQLGNLPRVMDAIFGPSP